MEQQSPAPLVMEPAGNLTLGRPIVTLGGIANVNSVEVRANDIYRSSNQLEVVRVVTRMPPVQLNANQAPAKADEVTGNVSEAKLEKDAAQRPNDADELQPQCQQQEVPVAEDLAMENDPNLSGEVLEPRLDEHRDTVDVSATAPEGEAAAGSSESKKRDSVNDTFVTEDTLAQVQQFLMAKVGLLTMLALMKRKRTFSHSQEIHEFVTQMLNEKQLKRYFPPLVQRIVDHFHLDAQAKHEDVSLDVQSSLCLLEQMFLTIGRASPFQDIYTAEEEEMLDQLALQSARRSTSEEQAC
ncbi:hypothetical protein FI667_g7063, partial [Globisporangium splendens]